MAEDPFDDADTWKQGAEARRHWYDMAWRERRRRALRRLEADFGGRLRFIEASDGSIRVLKTDRFED